MQDYTNEHQQWEAIQDWLRKNGVQLLVVFAISLAVAFGFRYWQSSHLEKKQQASQLFDQLLSVEKSDPQSSLIPRIIAELKNNYVRTPYAASAALFEAKNAVSNHHFQAAEQALSWAVAHATSSDIKTIATIRLARVLLADKKPEAALAQLEKNTDPAYLPAIEQVKGDIYLAQKDIPKARIAYQQAFNRMPPSEKMKAYVGMQLNQLPTP
jgi:predicted negative regulator of RcsB-dependent stress response